MTKNLAINVIQHYWKHKFAPGVQMPDGLEEWANEYMQEVYYGDLSTNEYESGYQKGFEDGYNEGLYDGLYK